MGIQTGLFGSFPLIDANIDARVSASIGAYILGDSFNSERDLIVRYVGRSDTDLNARLKNWVGSYNYFMYGHLTTEYDAYRKECHLYHAFMGNALDNSIHPAKPSSVFCQCPVCSD